MSFTKSTNTALAIIAAALAASAASAATEAASIKRFVIAGAGPAFFDLVSDAIDFSWC